MSKASEKEDQNPIKDVSEASSNSKQNDDLPSSPKSGRNQEPKLQRDKKSQESEKDNSKQSEKDTSKEDETDSSAPEVSSFQKMDAAIPKKEGVRIYISLRKIKEIFDNKLRQELEKSYQIQDTSDKFTSILKYEIGVTEMDIKCNVKFSCCSITMAEKTNTIDVKLRNQIVNGKLTLEAKKAGKLEKKYGIFFTLQIVQMTVMFKVIPQPSGIPYLDINITLQEFDLKKNLTYTVENSDMLSDMVSRYKSLWMGFLEYELKKRLLPEIKEQINKIVNKTTKSVYVLEHIFEGEENLKMSLACENFEVRERFAIMTVNGFFNNIKKPRQKSYTIMPEDYSLPDIWKAVGDDYTVIQASDDVLHSIVVSYFQNDLHFENEFTEAGSKSMIIEHNPVNIPIIHIKREKNLFGSEIYLELETLFTISIVHKILPKVKMGLRIHLRVHNFEVLDRPDDLEKTHVQFIISHIDIKEFFDAKMKPMSEKMKNSKILQSIREKSSKTQNTQEISIKKLRVGDTSVLNILDYKVYSDFITLLGQFVV